MKKKANHVWLIESKTGSRWWVQDGFAYNLRSDARLELKRLRSIGRFRTRRYEAVKP